MVGPLDPPVEGIAALVGPWSSPTGCRLRRGSSRPAAARCWSAPGSARGGLGRSSDHRLVDLTAVTTSTAVVQTRGRALRIDPEWPEKVALTWSVVCVSDRHPKGGNDWDRLVRKHDGYFGVDERGDVVDGVAHLDPAFSTFGAPRRRGVRRRQREDGGAQRGPRRDPGGVARRRAVRRQGRADGAHHPAPSGGCRRGRLPVVAAARRDHVELSRRGRAGAPGPGWPPCSSAG